MSLLVTFTRASLGAGRSFGVDRDADMLFLVVYFGLIGVNYGAVGTLVKVVLGLVVVESSALLITTACFLFFRPSVVEFLLFETLGETDTTFL